MVIFSEYAGMDPQLFHVQALAAVTRAFIRSIGNPVELKLPLRDTGRGEYNVYVNLTFAVEGYLKS